MEFNPSTYGPTIAALLADLPQSPLGPGTPYEAARPALETLTLDRAFEGGKIRDPNMASACLSGLWLANNFLDRSHTISQSIDTPTGGFWHGIMHRREGDYSNAKYWFRRAGPHPAFVNLSKEAVRIAGSFPAADKPLGALATKPMWDPFAFVDLCESRVGRGSEAESACVAIQQVEWRVLFDHCWRAASGG